MAVVVNLGPTGVDLTGVRAGDRNLISCRLHNNGTPTDLTGLTITAQARLTSTDDTALDSVIDITDATDGRFDMSWPGEDVTTMLAGQPSWKGVWDLQLDSGAGDPQTVAAGKFSAVMDVTRP